MDEPPPEKRLVRASASFPHGGVTYNIGQVCRHKKCNYICVVYGWDKLYNVLVYDGTSRDAGQEDLEPLDHPRVVTNPRIGRYFSQFDPKRGYVANKQSKEAYPDERD